MIKNMLAAVAIAGMLGLTAQAQTTPVGTTPASTRMGGSASKTGRSNSGDMAPNRSSTAGNRTASTSNNPVDATGKPVGTTQTTSTMGASKTQKPKK